MAPLRFVPKGNEAERQRFESQVMLALDKHVGGLVLGLTRSNVHRTRTTNATTTTPTRYGRTNTAGVPA